MEINPELDLKLERIVAVPRALMWRMWTEPEHLVQWFTPAPWSTASCEIDLKPGGAFNTTMRNPEGETFPSQGCYLEIIPEEKLVFTDALTAGFRPTEKPFMTAIILFEDVPEGTKYTAIARHRDPDSKAQHEEMGFHMGWNSALDQLIAHANSLSGQLSE